MPRVIQYLELIIFWLIALIPISIAIAPAPMNVLMGLLVVMSIFKKVLKREALFIRTAINWPLVFLFTLTCLSLFNSISYRDTFKGGIGRLAYCMIIFFIIAQEIRSIKQVRKIIFFIILGLILASLDAIWQVSSGKDFIRGYHPIINLGLVRATASFKDANVLGIYLSALAPLILGLTLYYFKGKKKISLLLLNLLILSGIALTYSRPTLLAVYIALFFLGIVKKDRALIIILVSLTLISPFILPKSVKNWAKEVDYNFIRFMCNDDRIAIYRNSLNMIKEHPFIGVGANTFMKNYKQYKESPEYRNVVTSDYMYAHNNFLHMAGEIGLIGLGVFIWLLYRLFTEGKNIYLKLRDNHLKVVSLSLIACLIAFLVNGLAESSLYYSSVVVLFWYLAGFLLSLKNIICETS